MRMDTGGRPLEGILVVGMEQAVAGPYCTSRLADGGARVIKVERPEGDFAREYDHVAHGESAYFVWLNRGKESIALDIKDAGDAALLEALISRADVFVQNFAPGALERAGFGSEALRARYPRLITCDISGYGEEGSWRDMKAYDFLIQCETGLASVTGSPDAPARVGVSAGDICCGMNAHAAILQALYERTFTGTGKGVSISLFDGLADWMTVPLLHQDYGGKPPMRSGLNHPSIAPYGAYAAGGGRQVVISIQNEREWRAFCVQVLRRGEVADDPRYASNTLRCANRETLDALISGVFSTLPLEDLIDRLKASRTAFGFVNGVAEFSDHPVLRRMEVPTPTGPVAIPASPWRWRGEPALRPGPSPALDAHGRSIREEFAS